MLGLRGASGATFFDDAEKGNVVLTAHVGAMERDGLPQQCRGVYSEDRDAVGSILHENIASYIALLAGATAGTNPA